MKEVKRIKCDFCKKLTVKEITMQKHEKQCVHNPYSYNCYMCKKAYQGDIDDGIWATQRKAVLCEYTEDEILSNIAETCPAYERDSCKYDERWLLK